MTIDRHSAIALVTPIGVTLGVKSVKATLDEGWSPYGQVTLVCSLPSPTDRDLLDLREHDLRLDLRLRRDFGDSGALADLTADIGGSVAALTALMGGQPLSSLTNRYYTPWNGASVRAAVTRNLNLLVTERRFDDIAKELTLTATTDESLLLGDALVSAAPWDPGTTSLKAIVQRVLTRYGATLDAASLDATVAVSTATIQQPGVGMWEYLDPMLEAASLRLWCDDQRVWRITERQSVVDGSVTITPSGSMTGHVDTMTFDPEVWYDAVVVEYRWVDDFGANHVAVDAAGAQPAKAVLRVVRENTRYPGPGAAAGILTRGQGRGRVLDARAISDYYVTPGMAATIVPPYTDSQTGYVSSVQWELPEAEMSLATRGLVEISPDSFLYGDDVTFADIAISNPTLAIQDFDWSLV